MDAVSVLLVLAAAGQAGWTPERTAAPPPAASADYDRYTQPPASGSSSVAPPPSVADRTRAAFNESGNALRDGFEAGVRAANDQLQEWTNRGAPSSGSPSQASNPFGAASSPAATGTSTRGGVAPPPWADPPAASAPDWDLASTDSGPSFGTNSLPALEPIRTDDGWTSIGSQVAAPPMLLPQLTSTATSAPPGAAPSGSGSSLADSSRYDTPPASGANSWATGWDNNPGTSPTTISRSAANTSQGSSASGRDQAPGQTADSRPPISQPPAQTNWADLWGDEDPWADRPQAPAASQAGQAAAAPPATPPTNASAGQPVVVPPANSFGTPAAATGVLQTSTAPPPAGNATAPAPATEPPPWMPLVVVSLSLAGSLGANFFLGWSYLDARQKYQSLVRKTANTFRHKAAA